jgi:hypothetical protein
MTTKTFSGSKFIINENFNIELFISKADFQYLKITIRVWHKANLFDFSFTNKEIGNFSIIHDLFLLKRNIYN